MRRMSRAEVSSTWKAEVREPVTEDLTTNDLRKMVVEARDLPQARAALAQLEQRLEDRIKRYAIVGEHRSEILDRRIVKLEEDLAEVRSTSVRMGRHRWLWIVGRLIVAAVGLGVAQWAGLETTQVLEVLMHLLPGT